MTWEGLGIFVESNGFYLDKIYVKMGGHLFFGPWISMYVKREREKSPLSLSKSVILT